MNQDEKKKKRIKQILVIGIVCLISLLIAIVMSIIGNQKVEKEWDKAMSDDRESYFSQKINDIVHNTEKSASQKNKELQELKEQRYDEYHVSEEYYLDLNKETKENISRILDNNFKGCDIDYFALYDVLVVNLKPKSIVGHAKDALLTSLDVVKEFANESIANGYIIIIDDNHYRLWVESEGEGDKVGYLLFYDTDQLVKREDDIVSLSDRLKILSEDDVMEMIDEQEHGLLALWTAEVLSDEPSGISYYFDGDLEGLDGKKHHAKITFCATPMIKKLFEFAKQHTVSEDGAGELYEQFSILYKLNVMSENLISEELPLLMGY